MAAYEVLKYRPEHKERLAELQCYLWSSDPSLNAAYLEWKYENNPYLDTIPIYVAVSRGEIVGMRGFFGSRWEGGHPREDVPVCCGDDLVIAPPHRNKGLFTLMMKVAIDDLRAGGARFALTLSAGTATTLGSLTMGWRSIGQTLPARRVSRRTRVTRRLQQYASAIQRLGWRLERLVGGRRPERFAHLDRQGRAASTSPAGVWLSREARPEAMAALIESLGSDGRIRHVRDATYFSWRFGNPMNEYRFIFAGTEMLTGYLVLRRCVSDRFDANCVHISDWEARDKRVKQELLDAAIAWGRFSELMTWTATLSDDTNRMLYEAGFSPPVPSARGIPCVLVKPLCTGATSTDPAFGGRPLLDPSSWDLRMLYSMQG